jgi:hypothetical protein
MAIDIITVKGRLVAQSRPSSIATRIDGATSVAISGDFNGWDPKGIPLAKNADGEWCRTFKLRPGEYQYRLLIDGEWHDHPEAEKRVPNPFGTDNCVLTVS